MKHWDTSWRNANFDITKSLKNTGKASNGVEKSWHNTNSKEQKEQSTEEPLITGIVYKKCGNIINNGQFVEKE